ncbi:MAG: hypothetical protein HQL41_13965 [Alphaproteobacteria bacterium]|nr:hypothetical protein [Alphaproteobacteria bacterium]
MAKRVGAELDGVWSSTVQQAALKFGQGRKIRLNQNWTVLPQRYQCPICQRSKPDLLRLDSKGEVMGAIVEHHDHIWNFINAERRRLRPDWNLHEPAPLRLYFSDHLRPFIERFAQIAICEDCNNIEALMKAAADADAFFSFSPQEIAAALTDVRPHERHQFSHAEARRLHEAAREVHQFRLKVASVLVQRAFEGKHWGEHPIGPSMDTVELVAEIRLAAVGAENKLRGYFERDGVTGGVVTGPVSGQARRFRRGKYRVLTADQVLARYQAARAETRSPEDEDE